MGWPINDSTYSSWAAPWAAHQLMGCILVGDTVKPGYGVWGLPPNPVPRFHRISNEDVPHPHTPDLGSQTPDPGSGDEPLWASAYPDLKPVRLDTPDLCPLYWAPGGAKTGHLEGLFETHYGQVHTPI